MVCCHGNTFSLLFIITTCSSGLKQAAPDWSILCRIVTWSSTRPFLWAWSRKLTLNHHHHHPHPLCCAQPASLFKKFGHTMIVNQWGLRKRPCDQQLSQQNQIYSTFTKTKWDDMKHQTSTSCCWCHIYSLQGGMRLAQRLYDVIIRGAMLIDINSWKRSLQAYGIRTREIWWADRQMTDWVSVY